MNAESTSVVGSDNLETTSHLSFKNIKIKHQNLFFKNNNKMDSGILPELSYFSTSMPLMNMNQTSTNSKGEKKKKLPKLSAQQFQIQSNKSNVE